MDLGLKGRVALVTGASKGIGFAIASGLAAEGARVVLAARGAEALDAAVERIRAAGGDAHGRTANVRDAQAIEALAEFTRETCGEIDVLVANARGPPPGLPSELSEQDWIDGWELTLMSAVRLANAVLPSMRRRGFGRILNVTSLSVREPLLNLTLSNAYRSAVTAYAKTLALEVAGDGVTVNNVAPGWTATERLGEVLASDEARRAKEASIPAGRFGTPDEVAAVAVFLASEQASYVTGQTITAEGGALPGLP